MTVAPRKMAVMASRRVLSCCWLTVVLLGACGSDSTNPGGGSSGPPPHVPDYIDLDVCASITEAMSLSFSGECSTCCKNAGFVDSSSINEDKCTCGNMPDSGGSTVCASQIASSDSCSACCDGAGYSIHFWIQGNSCQCNGKSDDTVCAGSAGDDGACARCCLGNGFLGFVFIGIGTPSCSCHGK